MLRRTACSGGLGRPERGVALGRGPVGLLDGAEPGGDPGLAGGDGLAVAAAVGAFGQALAGLLDLADVGLALVGVRGDGEQGDVGGGGVQDEADRLGLGVAAGQGEDPGAVGLGPGLLGWTRPCRTRSWNSASITSARSIWSQAAAKFSPTGPSSAPRLVQYSSSLAACGWSG